MTTILLANNIAVICLSSLASKQEVLELLAKGEPK